MRVEYSLVDSVYFDDDSPTELPEFLVWPRSVELTLIALTTDDLCKSTQAPAWITRLLRRVAKRNDLRLRNVGTDFQRRGCWIEPRLRVRRDARLDNTLQFVDSVTNAIAAAPEARSLDDLWDLLRDGLVEGLIGVRESNWFEAKSAPYDLSNVIGRLEWAKDVSAMANSGGGMLVLGYGTRQIDHVDTVHTVRPYPRSLLEVDRYRRVLRAVLYPPPSGLEYVYKPVTAERGVLGVRVPPQPDASWPILVVGMPDRVHERVEGNYIGLFHRHADGNMPANASTIHQALNRIYRS